MTTVGDVHWFRSRHYGPFDVTRILCVVALLAASGATPARAQADLLPPDTLPLNDHRAFGPGASGWRIVGDVAADRAHAGRVTTTPGAEVLVNLARNGQGTNIATTWEHGGLLLDLDVMLSKGSRSGVYLQGRYEVQLADSWGVRSPTFADAGGINERWDAARGPGREGFEGHAPRMNAGRAPGIWQHLTILFAAPQFDAQGHKVADARFVRVELNGVVIHENVSVTGPTRDAPFQDERPLGPLVLQGGEGPIAVRHVHFKRYSGERLHLSGLHFRVAEGAFATLADAAAGAPVRQGAADALSPSLAEVSDKFALTLDGTLHVPVAGAYRFDLGLDWVDDDPQFKGTVVGGARMVLDGHEVLLHEGRLRTAAGTAVLPVGDHAFSLTYYKNRPGNNRAGVTLFAEAPGVERHALHVPRVQDLPGAITVEPAVAAEVLRSFVRYGGGRRTHAVSVGDAAGVHYSYDLSWGALLSMWRGPFAETTDMWHERGEQQVMRPMGSAVTLAGSAPALAYLARPGAPWPDSTGTGLVYHGYALDRFGRPAFLFRLRDVDVEDRLMPADNGTSLRRELRMHSPSATTGLFVRVANGKRIKRQTDGSFLVDDAFYVVPGTTGLVLRDTAGGQELMAPIHFNSGTATLDYTYVW